MIEQDIRDLRECVRELADLVEYLLTKEYVSEFQVIDRLSQHPDASDFNTWLRNKFPQCWDGVPRP